MSGERLATVEARVEHIDTRLDQLAADVREIRDTLSKQRGFVAGAAAAFTLVWSAITAAVAYLLR